MPIQPGPQPLLIQEMRNQTNAPAEHEKTIQHAHLEIVLRLLLTEGAAVAQQIDEADRDAPVHVEDQIVLFRRRDRFHGEGVVEEFGRREVRLHVGFYEFDAEVGVVAGLDAVADAGD